MTQQEFKEIRLVIGLSQQQLALKLGILKNQISKIERGRDGIALEMRCSDGNSDTESKV